MAITSGFGVEKKDTSLSLSLILLPVVVLLSQVTPDRVELSSTSSSRKHVTSPLAPLCHQEPVGTALRESVLLLL